MLIQNSIIAGEILNILDNAKRAVSYDELRYYMEEPMQHIQAGVERLIREELAFLEIEDEILKIKSIPNLNQLNLSKEKVNADDLVFA